MSLFFWIVLINAGKSFNPSSLVHASIGVPPTLALMMPIGIWYCSYIFLAKKKGLLGRLGKSISTNPPEEAPQRVANQFLKYKGKIIRSVELVRLSFQSNIYDTTLVKYDLGVRLANVFHKNSREKVIRNNLFFKEGGRLYPYLVADNERYLRDLSFIQDARIIVDFAEDNTDSVDVVVITKDIFSMGGKLKIDSRPHEM